LEGLTGKTTTVWRLTSHAVCKRQAAEQNKIIESIQRNFGLFGIFSEECQFKKPDKVIGR
jgi:hypothetical protein